MTISNENNDLQRKIRPNVSGLRPKEFWTCVGVDPGFSGGVAKLTPTHLKTLSIDTFRMPNTSSSWPFPTLDCVKMSTCLDGVHSIKAAFIERVSAMPKQGVTGVFRFGFGAGSLHTFFEAHGIKVYSIPSAVWKAAYSLGRDKNDSIIKAELVFPGASFKGDGEAEAALIAHFGFTRLIDKEKNYVR